MRLLVIAAALAALAQHAHGAAPSQHLKPLIRIPGAGSDRFAAPVDPLANVQQLAEGLYQRNDLDVVDEFCDSKVVVHVSPRACARDDLAIDFSARAWRSIPAPRAAAGRRRVAASHAVRWRHLGQVHSQGMVCSLHGLAVQVSTLPPPPPPPWGCPAGGLWGGSAWLPRAVTHCPLVATRLWRRRFYELCESSAVKGFTEVFGFFHWQANNTGAMGAQPPPSLDTAASHPTQPARLRGSAPMGLRCTAAAATLLRR
jgi:hypothetical protein